MTPARELRRVMRVAGFGVVTAAMLPPFVVHQRVASMGAERDRVREAWVGAWCTALLRLFGIGVRVRGARPAAGRGHLVVANHRSTADVLILLRAFGGRMLSRADLANWPLVGPAARAAGTLFVDRKDAVSGATSVRTIRTHLARGDTVLVFPEGTTFADDEVRPFHAGTFVAALHSDADVVPVGIAYASGSGAAFVEESFRDHLVRMAAADPSHVALCIGDPIAIEGKTRAAALRDRAHTEVQRLVREARSLADGTRNTT